MRTAALDHRKDFFTLIILFFVLNPFWGCMIALFSLKTQDGINNKRAIYFFLAFFMGLVAYTQYTTVGDLSRTYEGIIEGAVAFKANCFSVFASKHILFGLVNQFVYYLTGNVRLISLIWIFVLYYFLFLSIDNIAKYKNRDLSGKELFLLLSATVFSFVIFTQVTEIMKQGIATSIFLYSYSLFLLKKKWQCAVWLFLALNVHFSVLFYVPLFLASLFSNKVLYFLFFFSLTMRQFDLMGTIAEYLQNFSGIGDIFLLGSLAMQVDEFHYNMEGFFSSGSFFFQFIYWHTFLAVLLLKCFKVDGVLIKASLLMLCLLNFNYYSDHNYTRLLTMMFPFFIMLSFEALELIKKNRKILVFIILIGGAFLANYRMSMSRLMDPTYSNSYMDGSLSNVLIYPSILYFY